MTRHFSHLSSLSSLHIMYLSYFLPLSSIILSATASSFTFMSPFPFQSTNEQFFTLNNPINIAWTTNLDAYTISLGQVPFSESARLTVGDIIDDGQFSSFLIYSMKSFHPRIASFRIQFLLFIISEDSEPAGRKNKLLIQRQPA